jgi:hypothetical protein
VLIFGILHTGQSFVHKYVIRLSFELKKKTKTNIIVVVIGRVVVAIHRTAILRIVVPTTST